MEDQEGEEQQGGSLKAEQAALYLRCVMKMMMIYGIDDIMIKSGSAMVESSIILQTSVTYTYLWVMSSPVKCIIGAVLIIQKLNIMY